jgi:hypothetical protein
MRIALPRWIAAVFYGAPRRRAGTLTRTIGAPWFLAVAALPMLLGTAMCLLLQVVDPYDLRPWGFPPKFVDENYPGSQTIYMMAGRTREPHDLALFGGSTTMGVTPAQLRAVFGAKTPVNLSYPLPSPEDSAMIMMHLIQTPGIRHIVMGVDHSQMGNDGIPYATGQLAMQSFVPRWFDMPDFNLRTIQATAQRAMGRPLDTATWRLEPATYYDARRLTAQPDLLALLDDSVVHPSPEMFIQPKLPRCRSYRFINRVVIPVGRAAQARGIAVDLLFPPLPPASLYNWQKRPAMMSFWTKGADYRQLLHFHECIAMVVAEEKLDAVKVHATDVDPALIHDLNNYRDTVHLTAPAALLRLMTDVRDGRFVLTTSGMAAYSETMEGEIRAAGMRRYGQH